jgi:hypothetical protein
MMIRFAQFASALLVILALCSTGTAHAYCLYNKTSRQTIQFAVADSVRALGSNADIAMPNLTANDKRIKPGETFCCKPGDSHCPITRTKTLDVTLEMLLSNPAQHPRCGSADARSGVQLLADGYLLIRNSRFDSTRPLGVKNAPIAIDSMSADGRLIQTFYCPVSGVGLLASDFK